MIELNSPKPPLSIVASLETAGVGAVGVMAGAAERTTEVADEVAVAVPTAFFAVTWSLSVCPTSLSASRYVAVLVPVETQLEPAESHTRHCRVKVIGVDPDHVPFELVRLWPACAVPVTTGTELTVGRVARRASAAGALASTATKRTPIAAIRPPVRRPVIDGLWD
ncbi:MAG: hypothetical protein H0U40_05725 [Chloroflexia bacterium]|nr:hypothetical protein [Chloroflexia bacterium]